MRKFLSLLLALLMLPLPGALAAEKCETLPEHMQMTQSFEHQRLGNNVSIDRAWPVTANESVNAELRAAIDQLETQGRAFLPARATRDKEGALLDVGATVYRTGESWASFLMTASVQDDRKQIYTAVDTRAYDLLTGKAITLSDVIADEAGWQIVADAVRAQASAYFPGEPADEARLDALTQELENAPKPQNLSVRDFGARGDGKSDDGPAIRRALEAAAAAKSPVRLHFPAGTYRIEPESRPPERRAWRNRISGGFSSWNADTLNQAHLRLLSPEHLTLEGEAGQTRLLFTNPALCGIRILGGYHTTLRNLTLDYETPPFTQGRIVAANAERTRLEVEINEGFPSPLAPNLLKAPSRRLTPLSPETRTYLPGTFPLGKVEPLGGRKFRIELGSFHAGTARTSLAPGNPVVITGRYDSRCANAISSILSKFDHFDAITVHSSPSWTWHLLSYAPILQNCRVEPEPGTARLISTNGDGLMFAAIGKVGPYLEHCTFSSMEDDGINLAASTVALTAVTPDGLRTLPERTMSNTSGVLILDGNTGKVKAVRRIVRRNGHPEYATPLPPGIAT